jgi:hypothetical protein
MAAIFFDGLSAVAEPTAAACANAAISSFERIF